MDPLCEGSSNIKGDPGAKKPGLHPDTGAAVVPDHLQEVSKHSGSYPGCAELLSP